MVQYEQMSREELILELRRKDELQGSYRTSLLAMREGFFLSEILYGENGCPCDYRYLDVNPAFQSMLGLQRDRIAGRRLKEVVPDPSPVWLEIFEQVASSGIPSYCCFFSESVAMWLEVYAFRPAVHHLGAIITDITERKEAEQALRESEARLRFFIEHAPVPLAMFDRDMRYLRASRCWKESYNLQDVDLLGRCTYDVSPEIGPEWREAHRRGLAGEVVTCDGERVELHGAVHWVSWKVQPWVDASGAIGGVVIFSNDISVVKEAEEALRKSEQRYRDIVENQSEYVDRYLPGGILTFVNSSLAAITGCKAEDLLGKSFYPFLHDDDRDEVIRVIEGLTPENPSAVADNRVYLPDGMHWLQWKHTALTDETGKIVEYQASGRDVTELRQMQDELLRHQEELRLANELLEQRVRERTADLEAAIRAQESFSYSVSHDFRAPLRHINSFSAMLIEDFAPTLPPEARGYLDRICAASSRMGALIDHLLELSRVTRAAIHPGKVDLSELAFSAMRMYQETEPERCVEVIIAQGITVMGDPSLLRQLLDNLLGNAWKYTARKEKGRIHFGRTTVCGADAYFVRDNGAGFDMKYREKLFNAFERLHGPEYEGLGIGLATAQQIIQRHGGEIWAEGAEGEGATFYFALPQ